MTASATMSQAEPVTESVFASGATMAVVKPETVIFVPKSSLIAGVLAVTMMSAPVVHAHAWPANGGGETVNRDIELADRTTVEPDDIDLDTVPLLAELTPLPRGFRLAVLAPSFPAPDPDLLMFNE
ncbi:MAG TPA: hypothetical protein VFE30_16855 [Anaeromyxobacteraceae bacterium]|jgi:hypothetical protein|nr:hypothetical protein [Anaeromyxobacteraceae bacterium]